MLPDYDLEEISLGSCCCCGKEGETVRNLVMLDRLAPVAGRGWGCVECNLPMNGALLVVCDDCIERGREPREVCYGYAAERRRVSVEDLEDAEFVHDLSKHRMTEFAWPN